MILEPRPAAKQRVYRGLQDNALHADTPPFDLGRNFWYHCLASLDCLLPRAPRTLRS
jgi:hypothetical protein